MKNISFYLSIYLLHLPINLFSQLEFNFETSNLDNWQQSVANHWAISSDGAISGKYSLQHSYDNLLAGNDQISFAYPQQISFTDSVIWEFKIRHGYNPSSGNNWAVFLSSDVPASLMTPVLASNALVIGVNFTGSDDLLKIWQVENGANKIALTTTVNWENTIGTDSFAQIKIIRTSDSVFKVFLSPNGYLENSIFAGMAKINSIPKTSYFGIYYKYTATQDRKLCVDDIAIHASFVSDTILPKVDNVYISSANKISIVFSESIKPESVDGSCSIINSNLNITRYDLIKDNILVLELNSNINQNTKLDIEIKSIQDLHGNIIEPKNYFIINSIANDYDISINEIMADPSPAISLPDCEYIELFNRTENDINLDKWTITIGSNTYKIPQIIIKPKDYLIVCNNKCVNSLKTYGNVIGVWTSDQAITNSGNTITLKDSSGRYIAYANYSDDWYRDNYKKSGGWSLEKIDPSNPCGGSENWKASKNKLGGTPGKVNSVNAINPDGSTPNIVSFAVPNDSLVILNFSETLNFSNLTDSVSFNIDKGIGYPKKIIFNNETLTSISLQFISKLAIGEIYQLSIKKDICDCAGNQLANVSILKLALPAQADSFDVIFNEILFNPLPFCAGFTEFYNRSDKVIDAGSLILAVIDTLTNQVKSFTPLANPGTLFMPNTYLLVTKNIENLRKYYNLNSTGNLIEEADFPSFDDKHGIVVLMKKDLSVIDKFEYRENMHNSLLSNLEGVSLERLNITASTNNSMNWQSAAQTAGFATPGYKNSQSTVVTTTNSGITISPEVFSPNSDAKDDYVNISINEEYKQFYAGIQIFNSLGELVKNIVAKEYLGSSNTFIWNGTSNENKILLPGIYLIYIRLFSEKGIVKEFKKPCVLVK